MREQQKQNFKSKKQDQKINANHATSSTDKNKTKSKYKDHLKQSASKEKPSFKEKHMKDAKAKGGSRGGRPYIAQRDGHHAEQLSVGDRIVVTIKRIGINGEGVGYYKRKTVFIEGALTGEVVKATITHVHPSFLQAKIIEIEKKSKHRQVPPCPVYEQCGGCQLQHMTYEAQLIAKAEIVAEAFQRYAKISTEELQLRATLGMKEPWHYRNKAQLQSGRQGDKLVTGLYATGTHKLIDISECLVQDKSINAVYAALKPLFEQYGIEPYNEKLNKGELKTVVVRVAKQTNALQLTLVTASGRALPNEAELIKDIVTTIPAIKSISQNIHPQKSSVIFGAETKLLWGDSYIEEQLGELKFSLSARAFFQLNPEQVVHLYDLAKEAAQLKGDESIVDLYCGTGTIGLWLAPYVKEVRGIEVIAEAVEDANRNAQQSGIENATFYVGRAEDTLPQWLKEGYKPDVVVVDPPRTGLDQRLIDTLITIKPNRIVYVSCNPSTLAKDCAQLLATHQYKLGWVQPVDMFAQTASVEVVTYLEKINK